MRTAEKLLYDISRIVPVMRVQAVGAMKTKRDTFTGREGQEEQQFYRSLQKVYKETAVDAAAKQKPLRSVTYLKCGMQMKLEEENSFDVRG